MVIMDTYGCHGIAESISQSLSKLFISKSVGHDVDSKSGSHVKFYQNRLKTFENWPLSCVSAETMAKAGFYYTGVRDRVSCYFCHEFFDFWIQDEDPYEEHVLRSPNCQFFERSWHNFSTLSDIQRFVNSVSVTSNTYISGFQKHYVSKESRLKSFENFKGNISQDLSVLSESGLVYFGDGKTDEMVCFCCGNGLKDWKDDDDPWIEHSRFFPDCAYIRLYKGNYFVESTFDSEAVKVKRSIIPTTTLRHCDEIDKTSFSGPIQALKILKRGRNNDDYIEPDIEIVKSNNLTINDESTCKICYMERLEVLFVPCGHVTACVQCAVTLDECSICRRPINMMMRIGVYSDGEKNEHSTEEATCMLCKNKPIQTVNMPCRHACMCTNCSVDEHRCILCFSIIYACLEVYA